MFQLDGGNFLEKENSMYKALLVNTTWLSKMCQSTYHYKDQEYDYKEYDYWGDKNWIGKGDNMEEVIFVLESFLYLAAIWWIKINVKASSYECVIYIVELLGSELKLQVLLLLWYYVLTSAGP